jgi:hypothetical protein
MTKKNIFIWNLLFFFVSMHGEVENFFSKVIIWGHPLHSHTHSYIHEAFYRTFMHLGYKTYWVKSIDELEGIDLHKALFVTEGQVDAEIPKRHDCYYILHNWNPDNYQELFKDNRCILLQVYTDDCLPYVTEKIADCIYSNSQEKMIFMPWATDLLPDEIDEIKQQLHIDKKEPIINWIGTIGGGRFGNEVELAGFKKACEENDILFRHYHNKSTQEGIDLIKSSYMAPAIQGTYQCKKGYIPCRIFKNISYGQWGITNNKTVSDLFKGKIVYNADTYQLFYDAQKYIETTSIEKLYELMDFVRDNHTYINRIETLLLFMKKALHILF